MTITSNDRRKIYNGNGVSDSFNGPRAFEASDISVFLVDADGAATQVSSGDYTITGLGRPQTRIVMNTPPAEGEQLLILRTVPVDQPTDITNQGAFLPEIHEDAFDRMVMQSQQLDDQVSRTFRLAETSVANVDFTVPEPEALALLGWDPMAARLINNPPDQFVTTATAGVPFSVPVTAGQTSVTVSTLKTPWSAQGVFYNGIFQAPTAYTRNGTSITFTEPLPADGEVVIIAVFGGPTNVTESDMLTYQRVAPGAVTRPVSEKLAEVPSVKDFGAKGDGVTDDTAALQTAIDSGANELFWPPGHYVTTATLRPAHNQSWVTPVGQTIIKPSASAPTNTHVIAHNTDGSAGPLVNFAMSGFIVDGNSKEGGLILYGCQRLRVTDCVFQNCETYGMGLQARPGYAIDEPQDDIILTRCQFNNNGQGSVFDGLDVKHCTNATLEACTATGNTDAGLNLRGSNLDLIGCQAVGNGTAGILLQSNYTTGVDSYIRVIGGQAYGTSGGPGLELQGDTGNTSYIEVSAFQSYSNTGVGVRISGSGKVTGSITALQSRSNTSHGVEITGDYSGALSFNGGLVAGNGGDGFRTAGKGAVLNGLAILNNTGAGYREVAGADNNYLMASCVVSGNATDVAARVGVETDAGFMAARSAHAVRMFPGKSSGIELQTDSGGAHSSVVAVGAAATIDLRLVTKGNGNITGYKGNGGQVLFDFKEAGSATVNYPEMTASLTGGAVLYGAAGTDANIDLQLNPKGSGRVRFGTHAAVGSETVTGYIEIKDSAGNTRKLAVIS